jgi:hypothetical protein
MFFLGNLPKRSIKVKLGSGADEKQKQNSEYLLQRNPQTPSERGKKPISNSRHHDEVGAEEGELVQ